MTKLWGGRFEKSPNKLAEAFGRSIHFDQKLARYDVEGSLYQIEALKKSKILNTTEYSRLKKGLKDLLTRIDSGRFKIDPSFEDIHSYIQHVLDKKVGKPAAKLHSCRSRNDQVVLDTKLYCVDHAQALTKTIGQFQKVLESTAKKNDYPIPGYTHLQHAIPVKLSDHLKAYVGMLERDKSRLINAVKNIQISLGSGSLAGTMIPAANYSIPEGQQITKTGKDLGAPKNAIDNVSDRDFVIEILNALAITGMHLSRLAEDMILWSSQEFDFVDIDQAFCTGSSLMPQKKNPDIFELIRGYTGRLYGNLTSVLVMMKGLPLSYNRDMQHDKEPLFDSFDIVGNSVAVLTELFKSIKFKKNNITAALTDENLYATDIADHLVKEGVAFKDAHTIVGKLIAYKEKSKKTLKDLTDAVLKEYHPSLTAQVLKKIIDPAASVKSKRSIRKGK